MAALAVVLVAAAELAGLGRAWALFLHVQQSFVHCWMSREFF